MAEQVVVPSLGGQVGLWIQSTCAIPDGERQGEPFLLTSEQWDFILNFYALTEKGGFMYRRGGIQVGPAKLGKGPLSAAIIAAEAFGPSRFAGWSDDGEPMGQPVATPWIQVAAVSESQTANVWRALIPMLQLGTLADAAEDIGQTRIILPGNGRIEFVSAAHRSRVGARVTFAVLDELSFWLPANHGHDLYGAIARNLAGMRGRFLGTTNAWSLNEDSVAERIVAEAGIYVDDVEPGRYSIRNKRERRAALERVYGSAASGCEAQGAAGQIEPWIDLDLINEAVESLLARDEPQARRFYLNEKLAASAAAFDIQRFRELANPDYLPQSGAGTVIAVDGAHNRDALAVIATEIETGFQWAVCIETRPENAAEGGYQHDLEVVDGAVTEAWERFNVLELRIDPQFIEPLVMRWQQRWGDHRVIPFYTGTQTSKIAHAVRRYGEAISSGELSHDGDPTFIEHVRNAVRRSASVRDDDGRPLFTIQKDGANSPRKIDAAMAALMGWEARYELVREDVKPPPKPSAATFGSSSLFTIDGRRVSFEEYREARRRYEEWAEQHGSSTTKREVAFL